MRAEELYEFTDDLGAVSSDGAPVLVYALQGFIDAGEAGTGFAEHLLATLPHRVVAKFDLDQLYDYRARRPTVVFNEDHFEQYVAPQLTLYALRDDADAEFLLLTGPEPDTQWERFSSAVTDLVAQLRVRLSVGVHGIPLTVPHTRPLGMTSHATRQELVGGNNAWEGELHMPAGAGTLLELRLAEAGHDAMGFAVHVPHYLAENRYPEAIIELLRAVSRVSGLLLPVGNLEDEAAYVSTLVESQVASNEAVQQVVHELEAQYDAQSDGGTRRELSELTDELPTGEEIAAEAQRFLAERNEDTDNS